jgi:hypothetical protein
VDDDPLESEPLVGVRRDLIRHRDKAHVGSIWLHRDTDYEFEDPVSGRRHASPIARDVILVVIRARGEEISRLRIPVEEVMGDKPYTPPAKGGGRDRSPRQPPLLP